MDAIPSFNLTLDKQYSLLGFTIFRARHFRMILFNGSNYFLIDDMKMERPVEIKETSNRITSIFYYKTK